MQKYLLLFFLHYFICIGTVKSLQFSLLFQTILSNYYYSNAFVNPKRKVTSETFGTQTTRNKIVRHKKSCSAGTLYCTHCPHFSTKSQNDLKYDIGKKHSSPKPDITCKCKLCYQEFPGFYALRQHRNPQHGMQIRPRRRDVDVDNIVREVEDQSLREELRFCKHFLVDSELQRAKHKVFNYAVETLNETIVNEKLDHFFNNLKRAAKVNLVFWFCSEKNRRRRSQKLLSTRKKYPAGSIQNLCAHMTTWQS